LLGVGEERLPRDTNIVVSPASGGGEKTVVVFFRPLRPGILSVLGKRARMRDFIDISEYQEPASLTGFNAFYSRIQSFLNADLKMDRFAEIIGVGNL